MTTDRRLRGNASNAALAVALALAISTNLSAHRTDEYLQAARIGLEPDLVEVYLDLTPGIDVAEPIIRAIDLDGDGQASTEEQRAYAGAVVRDLKIELDGRPVGLRLASSEFPALSTLRRGEGAVHLRLAASLGFVSSGSHTLFFSNAHHNVDGVYLANALVPESPRVRVEGQRRNWDQTELTIDYSLRPPDSSTLAIALSLAAAVSIVFFTRRPRPSER